MAMVVRVRFKRAGKLYDFDPDGLDLHAGMHVVTETVRGVELGECITGPMNLPDEHIIAPLKPIIRIATAQDMETQRRNEQSEKEAFSIALEKIAEHELEMKLVDVEYAFDHSKIIFYFTANGRVDFRMLVKNLASIFKTRIELRQIGVRDEAKMLGGIGPCGRPICCKTYLGDFTPVSIKMAKEQNLSLNPTKISGLCDRLMCCLKYEQDHYEATRKRMPRVGREIITPDGTGTINAINVLSETVRVRIAVGDAFELREYLIDDCQRPNHDQQGERPPRRERPLREEKPLDTAEENAGELLGGDGPDALGEMSDAPEAAAAESEAAECPPRRERPDRRERGARTERPPRGERSPRSEKTERPPREDRPQKGERAQRGEKAERLQREDRPPREDRPARENRRGQRPERPQREDRPARRERAPRAERMVMAENPATVAPMADETVVQQDISAVAAGGAQQIDLLMEVAAPEATVEITTESVLEDLL